MANGVWTPAGLAASHIAVVTKESEAIDRKPAVPQPSIKIASDLFAVFCTVAVDVIDGQKTWLSLATTRTRTTVGKQRLLAQLLVVLLGVPVVLCAALGVLPFARAAPRLQVLLIRSLLLVPTRLTNGERSPNRLAHAREHMNDKPRVREAF